MRKPVHTEAQRPPVFLHFFDWFNEHSWKEEAFADKLDWAAIGVFGEDRASEEFYYKQFKYIADLGVDGLVWEFHAQMGGSLSVPPPAALSALKRSGLTICPFLDLEITLKVLNFGVENMTATLTTSEGIKANAETVDLIVSQLTEFYSVVPPECRAKDALNRDLIYVFGFAFDRSGSDPVKWHQFGLDLVSRLKQVVLHPIFYWSFSNAPFLEHLLLHQRDHFTPFHFVLDNPQAQFNHDSVSWNFGFDNQGASDRDGLERVIRNDLRYLQEMGWLAGSTRPSAIFIYSWNEAFEGSMLLPTELWGSAKAELAKDFIERLSAPDYPPMPETLILIDDLNDAPDDWHTMILRNMLWYQLRRLAPQADVRIVSEAASMDLSRYEFLIDLSVRKSKTLTDRLLSLEAHQKLLFVDPLAGSEESPLTAAFACGRVSYQSLNKDAYIEDTNTEFFARDDISYFEPRNNVVVTAYMRSGDIRVPLISTVGQAVWLNAFTNHDEVLGRAFEALYGRPLSYSIMYGEGHLSQRLRVDPTRVDFEAQDLRRYSANLHWSLPAGLDLARPVSGVPERYHRFIYGLDQAKA